MNILIDKLPTEKDGLIINTSFRACILFEIMMTDKKISDENKILATLDLFFNNLPSNYEKALKNPSQALQVALWFYKGDLKEDIKKEVGYKEKNVTKQVRNDIYSFEFDDEYIFDSFLEQYNIDLNEIDLHWWKFKAMFKGLNENLLFSKIMSYRAIDLSKIKDKEEKKRYKKLKEIYKLPDMRTQEEKEAEFNSLFW